MVASVADMIYYPVTDDTMVRGEGVYLYDDEGNAYIDCASATFNLSLGYSHPAVVGAIQKQAESLIHVTSSFQSGSGPWPPRRARRGDTPPVPTCGSPVRRARHRPLSTDSGGGIRAACSARHWTGGGSPQS
jgi:hypothetical protein